MDITISIPAEKVDKVLAAFSSRFRYEPQIEVNDELVPNPETEAAFAKRHVKEFIIKVTKKHLKKLESDPVTFDLE